MGDTELVADFSSSLLRLMAGADRRKKKRPRAIERVPRGLEVLVPLPVMLALDVPRSDARGGGEGWDRYWRNASQHSGGTWCITLRRRFACEKESRPTRLLSHVIR